MNKVEFISKFTNDVDATDYQASHFYADADFARKSGYKFISTNDGTKFGISDDGLEYLPQEEKETEVETPEEKENLNSEYANLEEISLSEVVSNVMEKISQLVDGKANNDTSVAEPGDEDKCNINIQNIRLISQIINNTLTQEIAITPKTAKTMALLVDIQKNIMINNQISIKEVN